MLTRIVTALVAIAVFLPVLWFSNTVVFAAVLALLSLVAVLEMLRCTGLFGKWALTVPSCAVAVALPLMSFWLSRSALEHCAVAALIVTLVYTFAVMTFSRGKLTLTDASVALMSTSYIIVAFTAIGLLRYATEQGAYVYLICFIGAWVTDTFAYFTGRLLGKHKLIPDVSPKKTVEGSIGGIVVCIGSMVLYGFIVSRISQGTVTANYVMLGVSGLFVSIVSQVGDLLMSAIKRTYGVKDYGKLFPGHGGVLDRFDSTLAVAVILAAFCSFFDFFQTIV